MRSPRRKSTNSPGDAHALTFSVYRRYPFLRSERTCLWLADAIDAARTRHGFQLWAYVFMPDHVHLVVCPGPGGAGILLILKSIKQPVAQRAIAYLKANSPGWLHRITKCRGARRERRFWESGGGFDRNLSDGVQLQSMIDYMHQNPCRKGLVDRETDWKWSSAGWFASEASAALIPDRIPPEWFDCQSCV